MFKKVVGFSNGEFDKFSTASLITRSTNDIQQIQMLTVMMLRLVIYAPILGLGGVFKVFHTNVSMSWDHRTCSSSDLMCCDCIVCCGNAEIQDVANLVDN